MAEHYIETHFQLEVDPYKHHPNNGFLMHNGRDFMPISEIANMRAVLSFLKKKNCCFKYRRQRLMTKRRCKILGIYLILDHPGRAYDPKTGDNVRRSVHPEGVSRNHLP